MSALQEIAIDIEAERVAERGVERKRVGSSIRSFALWFAALPIGRKIQVFFGCNLAFALIAGGFVALGYLQLADRADKVKTEMSYALTGEELVTIMSEAHRHASLLVATQDVVQAEAALNSLTAADAKIVELRAQVEDNNQDAFQSLAEIDAVVEDFRRQIASLRTSQNDEIRRQNQASEVQTAGSFALEASREVAASLKAKAVTVSDANTSLITKILAAWLVLSGLLAIVTVLGVRYFDRLVGVSLKRMTAEMTKLAAGSRDITVPDRHRLDEIGGVGSRHGGVPHRKQKA